MQLFLRDLSISNIKTGTLHCSWYIYNLNKWASGSWLSFQSESVYLIPKKHVGSSISCSSYSRNWSKWRRNTISISRHVSKFPCTKQVHASWWVLLVSCHPAYLCPLGLVGRLLASLMVTANLVRGAEVFDSKYFECEFPTWHNCHFSVRVWLFVPNLANFFDNEEKRRGENNPEEWKDAPSLGDIKRQVALYPSKIIDLLGQTAVWNMGCQPLSKGRLWVS